MHELAFSVCLSDPTQRLLAPGFHRGTELEFTVAGAAVLRQEFENLVFFVKNLLLADRNLRVGVPRGHVVRGNVCFYRESNPCVFLFINF